MTQNPKHLRSAESCSDSLQIERPVKVAKTQYLSDQEEEDQEGQLTSISRQPMNPNPRVQRYLFAVEYIGTRFSGSQKQPKFRTVVGVLEDAFRKFIGQPVPVTCSSRTDAGVHALSNVFHVDIERISKRKPGEVLPPHEPSVVKRAVNHFLQNEGDLTVVDVQCIPFDFHARFSAQERIYFYRLLSGPELLSTFEKDRAWHVPEELNLQAMQEACKILVGCHDFSSFRAAGCQAKSPIRTLDELNVTEVVPGLYFPCAAERQKNVSTIQNLNGFSIKSEDEIAHSSMSVESKITALDGHTGIEFGKRSMHRCFVITARARAFLYHQVRLLVGVLKAVGTGSLTISDVERILNAKTVTAASPMAPACGLFLGQVRGRRILVPRGFHVVLPHEFSCFILECNKDGEDTSCETHSTC